MLSLLVVRVEDFRSLRSPIPKRDVPVGLFAARTIRLGSMPFKIQGGLEYSVVSPDAFGKRLAFRFVVTPVIPGLFKKPIFGGG